MPHRLSLAVMTVLVCAAGAVLVAHSNSQDTESKVVIPANKTSPVDGKKMYQNYCAPCHGVDAKGNGPVASALKTRPTDLTVLIRNNSGKFPDAHLVSVLEFGSEHPAHGTAAMPVWGPILGRMNQMNSMDKQLRISNLVEYIKSLQVK
jgi:mono/diheme cytochrome c family protein